MKQLFAAIALVLFLCLQSCTIGRARTFDTRQSLTGLDLAYLQSRIEPTHGENIQSVDGRLNGTPFWFLPGLGLHVQGTNAQHRGDLEPRDGNSGPAVSAISGYEHSDLRAAGLGLLTYQQEAASWDEEGSLQRWAHSAGFGWGLVYSNKEWGDADGRNGLSVQMGAGLLGYTEDQGKGYLKLLWIPIPIRW